MLEVHCASRSFVLVIVPLLEGSGFEPLQVTLIDKLLLRTRNNGGARTVNERQIVVKVSLDDL